MAVRPEARDIGPTRADFISRAQLRPDRVSPAQSEPRTVKPALSPVSEIDQVQISRLSRGIVNTYSRLDATVLSEMEGGLVVDAYSVGPDDLALITPIEKEEALENLKSYLTEIESLSLESLPREWTSIYGNMLATLVYFDELKRQKRGEPKRDYQEYMKLVSGFDPIFIPTEELKETRLSIIDKLKGLGLKFRRDSTNSVLAAYFAYTDNVRRYKTPEGVEQAFFDHYSRFKQPYASALGEDLNGVNFRIVWTRVRSWWMMFERIGIAENILYANWYRDLRKDWNEGRIEVYGYHEPAHFIWAHLQKEEIKKGNLDRAAGIVPIPSPTTFQLEGIAQTVPEFTSVQSLLSPDGHIAQEAYRLEKLAFANALFMLETDPKLTPEKAEKEIRPFMFFKTPRQTRATLRMGLNDPFDRAIIPVYGVSDHYLRQNAKKMDFEHRMTYFESAHKRLMTPAEIINFPEEVPQAA